jgi:hypothetical protein
MTVTRRLLASAYLSAMFLSGLSQPSGPSALAAPVNPSAAAALKSALGASSALGGSAEFTPVAAVEPQALASTPQTDPEPITQADFDRLVGMVRARQKIFDIDAVVTSTLGLTGPGEIMQTRQLGANVADGRHTIAVSIKPGSDDILIMRRRTDLNRVETYLTNSRRELRAALVNDASGTRLITNEQAAAGFREELKFFSDAVRAQSNG